MSFGKPSKKGNGVDQLGLSKETASLLNDVMLKRGLSLRSQQDVANSLKQGDSSWVDRVSTGVAAFSAPTSKTKPPVKVPKVGRGVGMLPPAMPPASFSGKRMVAQMAPNERERAPAMAPGPNRDALKDACAAVVELGAQGVRERGRQQAEAAAAAERAAREARPVNVREALVDQLVQEIQERSEFLDAMRAAGRGGAYEAQVRGEISERMRALAKYGVDVGAGAPEPGTRVGGGAVTTGLRVWAVGW